MSESHIHKQLVSLIIREVLNLVGLDNQVFMETDNADEYALASKMSEGFRPDVYYEYKDILIIGEAKTSEDIETTHSREQYESYIRKCSMVEGKAYLILAVPWMDHAKIHNIVNRIRKKYPGNYEIMVLDGIGGAI